MIDPSIITRGAERAQLQQQQNMEMLGNLGGALGEMVLGRRINQMRQLKTPEEQNAFANDSIFAPQLNQVLKGDRATAQKNAIDLLKAQSEIGKTNSEATKNNAQAGGFTLDNSQKLLSAADRALTAAAQSGNPLAAKLALSNAAKAGAITPEMYEQYNSQIDILSTQPEALKQFAQNLVLSNAKDPDKYLFSTADNQLDNQTQLDIAEANRQFDYEKLKSDDQYRRDALGQDDAQFWAEYGQKDAQFSTSQDTERLKIAMQKQVTAEKPEQKMERINSAIASADATAQAARAAKDAAELINHPGLNMGTGLTSAFGMIPSTDAKDFQARLENLKSQVFLPTVKAMQGMGALSNAEGEKIAAAVANLDPKIGPDAMRQQLSIIARQMANAAQKSKQQTLNYASRGGTIPLNTQKPQQQNGNGKIFSRAMVQEYSRQTGVPVKDIIAQIQQSGGSVQ
ncbi:hypothetical protein B7L44_07010 [Acinetobacter nosocomialis]|uniref:hypothetical protein n=1 Tax=Acinetobacter nosocomialis TaxID=106654 RepID=UPI0009E0F8DC|nr:hypothetical protein [Acinetobacter nosocomialis]ARG16366.1 hypothetical protein B7L44_07010 [Acinetobacter nosocomialis]